MLSLVPVRQLACSHLPAGQGSTDCESFARLIDLLAYHSIGALDAAVSCYFAPLATVDSDFDTPLVVRRRLRELADLYEWERVDGSPSNIWPDDKSWFVYTDWDLTATKVSGSRELVAAIERDDALETISYP